MTRRHFVFAVSSIYYSSLVEAVGGQKSIRRDTTRITVNNIPPVGPGSGTETYVIAGTVRMKNSSKYKIVVYTHTDFWYVQPTEDAPLTDIGSDGSWNTTVHPGDKYAVLVVDPEYSPPAKKPSIPPVGGYVLALKLLP